jgi:hypothetical protein
MLAGRVDEQTSCTERLRELLGEVRMVADADVDDTGIVRNQREHGVVRCPPVKTHPP